MGILDDMDSTHIQKVWDELADRFGFPEKVWKALFKKYLDKQPREVGEVSAFLRFGHAKNSINDILNGILCRTSGINTFEKLCIYVVEQSNSYKAKASVRKNYKRV